VLRVAEPERLARAITEHAERTGRRVRIAALDTAPQRLRVLPVPVHLHHPLLTDRRSAT